MKILDKKGRLFGKINIIDLLVIFLIVLIVGRFALRAIDSTTAPNEGRDVVTETQTLEYDFKVLKVREATVNAVKEGDIVTDAETSTVLGKITKVEITPAVDEVVLEDGSTKIIEYQLYYDLTATIETQGIANDNTILVGKKELRVGGQVTLNSSHFSILGNVWRIEVKE